MWSALEGDFFFVIEFLSGLRPWRIREGDKLRPDGRSYPLTALRAWDRRTWDRRVSCCRLNWSCPSSIDWEYKPRSTRHCWTSQQWHPAIGHEDAGDFAAAADAYRRAVRLEPDDPILHFNLANALYVLGETDQAAAEFRQAVRYDPDYAEAWNNLGTLLTEGEHRDEAIAAFGRALAVVPQYADAHFNLAETLAAAGCTSEACEHWRAYLALDPASPWASEARRRLAQFDHQPRTIPLPAGR